MQCSINDANSLLSKKIQESLNITMDKIVETDTEMRLIFDHEASATSNDLQKEVIESGEVLADKISFTNRQMGKNEYSLSKVEVTMKHVYDELQNSIQDIDSNIDARVARIIEENSPKARLSRTSSQSVVVSMGYSKRGIKIVKSTMKRF